MAGSDSKQLIENTHYMIADLDSQVSIWSFSVTHNDFSVIFYSCLCKKGLVMPLDDTLYYIIFLHYIILYISILLVEYIFLYFLYTIFVY